MTPLLASLASGFVGNDQRRAMLDAVLREELPTPKVEAWKYTSLRALGERRFTPVTDAPATTIDPALLAAIPAPRLVYVNGRIDRTLCALEHLPAGLRVHDLGDAPCLGDAHDTGGFERCFDRPDELFARLNVALADAGALIRVDAGVRIERPLHLVVVGAPATSDLGWHLRQRIELHADSALIVVEHHLAADAHAHLGNALSHVHLAAGAHLQHLRIQRECSGASLLTGTDAVLARDASYRRVDLELGAGFSRHELNVRLHGEHARMLANGVLLADGNRHLDTRLRIEHIAGDAACDLLWRGLAADRGRAVFHGGILIHPGADGSDARLSNKNLLLSDDARIDTQPVLEIHADEVKAAHGATVGQLDEAALFYLRSRGLPLAQARALLTAAFCRQALTVLDDAAMQAMAAQALDQALGRVEAGA